MKKHHYSMVDLFENYCDFSSDSSNEDNQSGSSDEEYFNNLDYSFMDKALKEENLSKQETKIREITK